MMVEDWVVAEMVLMEATAMAKYPNLMVRRRAAGEWVLPYWP